MHHGNTSFHCSIGHDNAPICKIDKIYMRHRDRVIYQIAVDSVDSAGGRCISIFCDEQQLIAFKNSVIAEYERIRRERDGR